MNVRCAFICLTLNFCLGQLVRAADAPTALQVKSDTLSYLQNMREQNVKHLREIDQSLRTKMSEDGVADVEREVTRLRDERHEHMLRQDFLSRLIFQVDTRFSGGDLRLFLRQALGEMATTDVTSTAATDPGLWKFLKFASEALNHLPEKREDILGFLDGYMQRSVANPMNPTKYLDSRNYTNGLKSESGQPMRADEVGALADKRLREAQAPALPTVKQRRKR